MTDKSDELPNAECAKAANHLGKLIAPLIAVANHRDVWMILFDECKKQGWKVKDETKKI